MANVSSSCRSVVPRFLSKRYFSSFARYSLISVRDTEPTFAEYSVFPAMRILLGMSPANRRPHAPAASSSPGSDNAFDAERPPARALLRAAAGYRLSKYENENDY
ncbi:hypothetical protein [Paludibacterium paludis]|uniref:hypothetical protein n=1 Tax=Paludibacterium paludis TaxID=1225769 RepID=UPI00167756AD|nr:hypothetical protein [Paludibacterium paludis]